MLRMPAMAGEVALIRQRLSRLPPYERPLLIARVWAAILLGMARRQGLELDRISCAPFGGISLSFVRHGISPGVGRRQAVLCVDGDGDIVAIADDPSAEGGEWLWHVERTALGLLHALRAIHFLLNGPPSRAPAPRRPPRSPPPVAPPGRPPRSPLLPGGRAVEAAQPARGRAKPGA